MGRYIHGDEDFEYKYPFGEQPSNLCHLAAVSGAGAVSLFLKIETPDNEYICKPEFLNLARFENRFTAFEGMSTQIWSACELGPSGLAEYLENPKELDLSQDEYIFTATTVYSITNTESRRLLNWVNSYLPSKLTLSFTDLANDYGSDDDEMTGKVADAAASLYDQTSEYNLLPYLGFHILGFVVTNELEEFGAEDDDAHIEQTIWQKNRRAELRKPNEQDESASYEKKSFARLQERANSEGGVILTPAPRANTPTAKTRTRSDLIDHFVAVAHAPRRNAQEQLVAAVAAFCLSTADDNSAFSFARDMLQNAINHVPMPSVQQWQNVIAELVSQKQKGAAKRVLQLARSQGLSKAHAAEIATVL